MKFVKSPVLLLLFIMCKIKMQGQDLPLVITKARPDTTPMIVLISDEKGWLEFEEGLREEFVAKNCPFMGLNANLYFADKKTPQQSAKDLAPIMRKYAGDWQRGKIILIGNGFGAGVVPFIYENLPDDLKNKIVKIVLLSPQRASDFQIHQKVLLGHSDGNYAFNVPYQISKIKRIPVLCFWTENDKPFYKENNKPNNVAMQIFRDSKHLTDYKTIAKLSQ